MLFEFLNAGEAGKGEAVLSCFASDSLLFGSADFYICLLLFVW